MKKIFYISFSIFIALILRIYISINIIPKGDILIHREWAEFLYHQGLSGSYFSQGWTYSPPTQPPLMMIAHSLSHSIYENRNFFSAMHNAIKVPPTSILLGFQKYGEILTLRLWEFLATLIISLAFYFHFSQKHSFKKSFLIFLLILFNPITIFINSVWGQNDLLPTCFLYLSFLSIFSSFSVFSPLIFTLGILFKPTIAIISPLFGIIYLYHLHQKNFKNKTIKVILAIASVLLLIFASFKLFIPLETKPIGYISSIINHRINTSSKGLKMASVSAFNLYSLLFNIDQTYATNDSFVIQMADVGLVFYIILNVFFIYQIIKFKKITFCHSLFIIYFISQGSFLLMTNMLDRYFFPAFLSSVIITIIYWKKFGWLMIFQQLIWFLNLIYSYYYRNNDFINHSFRNNNFFLIRLLSFINIFVFYRMIRVYLSSHPSSISK